MRFRTVTAPSVEPVTLTEAKAWCRETASDQDTLISGLITAHRIFAENVLTGRAFVQRTLQAFCDEFPSCFKLPFPPLQSVSAIEYLDADGALQTLSSSLYQVDIYSEPGRVKVSYGNSWPAIRASDFNPVRVTFVCGYAPVGSPSDYVAGVPQNLKEWLLRRVATAYDTPEALSIDARGLIVVKRDFVDGMIDDLALGERVI